MKAVRNHGLTLVLVFLTLVSMLGLILAGHQSFNDDALDHAREGVSLLEYMTTGHLWEAVAENWESAFLQLTMFLVLTTYLFQKGSPESKDPDAPPKPPTQAQPDNLKAPWPVRRGGLALWIYSRSLSLTFGVIFLLALSLHVWAGAKEFNGEQRMHGQPAIGTLEFLGNARFWHQALQNWQSEFLSLAAMAYLSVYLRQEGSPESKEVATPHHEHDKKE